MPSTGTLLITVVGVVTSVGAYIADWNETHIYNPRWPPHAKFHNGQTMSMGLILGLTTLYYLYRAASDPDVKHHFIHTAAWTGSIYWITQLSAFLYPGSLAVDPEFGTFAPQHYALFCFHWFDDGKIQIGSFFVSWREELKIGMIQLLPDSLSSFFVKAFTYSSP
ncbi:unnamed protein product [Penicillium bialowiezense]